MHPSSHRRTMLLGLLLLFLLSACSRTPSLSTTPEPAPTLSNLFVTPDAVPTPVLVTESSPIPITRPNATAIAQATNTALGEDKLVVVPVYGDSLSADWSLEQSFQTEIDLLNRAYVQNGRYSIKVKPLFTTGTLYFTLKPTAKQTFLRSRVQGVRFSLSGGPLAINNDALTVAVVGSNAKPYWVANDTSVQFDGRVTDNEPIFSETRLVFLGINTAIPAKKSVEVTVWLDSLLYDPTYKYVTGFYLKTDRQSVPTFYVDQVSLLLLPER
nr:hypothetical protein [Oscillochloris trichoides]